MVRASSWSTSSACRAPQRSTIATAAKDTHGISPKTGRSSARSWQPTRFPGSRTIRDLMITSGKGSSQKLRRTFRRLRQEKATTNEQDSQVEEEMLENDVMDAEGPLHQKPREVCLTEDAESIYLGWIENTKLNRVKKWDSMCVTGWRSRLGITGHISVDDSKKGFCETVAEVIVAEAEGEDDIHPSKKTTSGGTSSYTCPRLRSSHGIAILT